MAVSPLNQQVARLRVDDGVSSTIAEDGVITKEEVAAVEQVIEGIAGDAVREQGTDNVFNGIKRVGPSCSGSLLRSQIHSNRTAGGLVADGVDADTTSQQVVTKVANQRVITRPPIERVVHIAAKKCVFA